MKHRLTCSFIWVTPEGSEDMITSWCKEQNPDCEVYMVLGNNDFFSHLDREKEISIGKYRAFLTHGHFYSVSVGTGAPDR